MADCLKLIDDANNGRLTDQELSDIIEDLQAAKNAQRAASKLESVEESIFERGAYLVKEAELAAKIAKRSRYIEILREKNLLELADRADKAVNDPSLGLEAALVGVNAGFEGALRSVDSLMNSLGGQYFGGMIADLKKAKLLTDFNTMRKDLEIEVSRALANLNKKVPETDIDASPKAQKIAKIMFKYQRSALHRENKAGAFIRLKEGRVVRASHDPRKMTNVGKDAWVNYMSEGGRINWANADDAAKRGFLERSYEAITTGVRLSSDTTELSKAFTGPQNLAKARSESAVFTFKDADTWYEYDQQFGRGSLREAFVQDLQSSFRSIALLEQFGTNPEAMFKKVQKKLLKKYRSDPKKT